MSTTIFGKAAIFFSQCRMMNVPLRTGVDEFGIPSSPTKNAKISARETNRTKKSMSTTAQTSWPSSAEIWEGQRNYSLKNEVDKDAISCFSIRKDWRFAVRAKSFALHWHSRGFFRGHVRSCEKGLWPSRETIDRYAPPSFSSYPKTRVIIDCTESYSERPTSVNAQVYT